MLLWLFGSSRGISVQKRDGAPVRVSAVHNNGSKCSSWVNIVGWGPTLGGKLAGACQFSSLYSLWGQREKKEDAKLIDDWWIERRGHVWWSSCKLDRSDWVPSKKLSNFCLIGWILPGVQGSFSCSERSEEERRLIWSRQEETREQKFRRLLPQSKRLTRGVVLVDER